MNKVKLLILLMWMGMLPVVGWAQFTETKEISKQFKVSSGTQIEFTNKYGKIDVKTWTKDSVAFQINIRVEAKKLSKLEEAISDMDFDITHNDHYVIVRTIVEKNKSTIGKEISRFKESLLKSDGNIQVDYAVWMPEENALKIENKFGDIYLEDLYGSVDINLSNGNLKANDFYGETNLNLSFSDGNINSLQQGSIECNFGEIFIRNAGVLRILSKSSDFDINEADKLEVESRRDKFRIRQINVLENKSSFSTFRIGDLDDRLTFRSEYGGIDVEKTADDFSTMLIESKSSDINLYFNTETSFGFSFTLNDVETSYFDMLRTTSEEIIDDKGKEIRTKGYIGEKENPTEKLKIIASSGKLNIRKE